MAEKDDKPGGFSVSRRDFLKTAGVVSAVTAATSPAEADAQAAVNGVGPGDVPVRLTVNGKRVDLMIEPRVTLLDALRMNGEAGTAGREALLVWKVDRGSFDGVPLNGLAVVAAIAGDQNLGIREIGGAATPTRAAIFVDERANPAQRAALISLAKQHSNGMVSTVVELTPTTIQFADEPAAIKVSAKSLRLTVEKEMNHDPSCGSRQWFHPFADVSDAMMGTTSENVFNGAALGTKWSDPNKRSSFFGTFAY